MAAVTDVAYAVTADLFGPGAEVPGWAWLALLGMIFWGLLVLGRQDG
jgi:hypothetical protein